MPGLFESGCGDTETCSMAFSDPGDDFVEVVAMSSTSDDDSGAFAYTQMMSEGDLLWHREHCGNWRSQRNFDLAQESQDLLSVVRIVR